ncbi:Cilia- and flagella-associated protein 157 [Collichthys lucidus]|uniref:Cilia- and flagella-associated protein 157 n=1 Tax=Collichthys lucidus TaxID=240159 RepID=A0A4U5US29_COLLU|nr:Cilia- and flagella-associated protein 157 [Collichthys lucidus]
MPKKKDKKTGDKQKEDKKTSKKDTSATPANKSSHDEKDKDLYLTQIRHLDEQLERYQLKYDQVERQKNDLNSQYSALEKEKKDIVEYLKRSVLEKEEEVDELKERLESQQKAADKDKDALQLQHSQLRQELQDRIDELTTENMTLVARLAGLEEFQKQKEELISNMESLEKQLTSQKEKHKADVHSLEMKALLEQKRLEKEMESHVAAMAAQEQHLVDQKVPETIRLALQENTEVKAQFNQLSEQAQVLMGQNSALRARKSQLSVDLGILEEMLSEMSHQSCIRKKVVEQLTEKCQQLQAELKDCSQERKQLQAENTRVLIEMEALRQGRAALSEQCSKTRTEVRRLEVELEEERRRRSRMKSNMQEVAITLKQAMTEAATEKDSEVDLQWRQLMQKVLVVMDMPTLTNSTTKSNQLNELQTSDPVAARTGMNYKHTLSRTGAVSSSTHTPLYRKSSSQKTVGSSKPPDSTVRFLTTRNSFSKRK